jgi:very-short-patch-repair endonuclease
MESLLYMLLTVPNHYGGYGLSGATLNHPIKLPLTTQFELKQNTFFVDLYWDKAKIVLEYDSYEHHASQQSWVRDSRRFTALEALGYHTMSINTAQIYNEAAISELAKAVAKGLRKRIRIRNKAFADMHQQLRMMLPRS